LKEDEARRKIEEIQAICEKPGLEFVPSAIAWILKDRLDQLAEFLEKREPNKKATSTQSVSGPPKVGRESMGQADER
jgi:hypothetical protein